MHVLCSSSNHGAASPTTNPLNALGAPGQRALALLNISHQPPPCESTRVPAGCTMRAQKPTVSRSQARKAVKGLVLKSWRERKQPTILVGHALHHDLMALRLDHQPVIDTSLIFSYRCASGVGHVLLLLHPLPQVCSGSWLCPPPAGARRVVYLYVCAGVSF